MFMPITLIRHVAKHCNHVVNSPDENNYIVVYATLLNLTTIVEFDNVVQF